MDVDNRALRGIDKKDRLRGLYATVTPLEMVARRFSAVEVRGVDSSVTELVELLRL